MKSLLNRIAVSAALGTALLTSSVLAGPALAGGRPAPMPAGNIVGAAASSPDHKTLVAAVKAAGLVETLSGQGPFTVFAPTDAAFARLPAGTVETLLQPAERDRLQNVLTYHVVPGRITAADLVASIRRSGGEAMLTTVQGGRLTARLAGDSVLITDMNGGTATVTRADLVQRNGVIHVTDSVFIPG